MNKTYVEPILFDNKIFLWIQFNFIILRLLKKYINTTTDDGDGDGRTDRIRDSVSFQEPINYIYRYKIY